MNEAVEGRRLGRKGGGWFRSRTDILSFFKIVVPGMLVAEICLALVESANQHASQSPAGHSTGFGHFEEPRSHALYT